MPVVAIEALCTLSLFIAAMICSYHLALAVVALFLPNVRPAKQVAIHDFAIIVPAHNEELILGDTLDSCAQLDYPSDKFTVYVIADNCTDHTAAVARSHGVTCLVRCDDRNRGKGHALEWAFPQLQDRCHDAFVVLDADCLLDTHAIRRFDEELSHGAWVLQASDVVSNVDENAMTFMLALANSAENDLFYAPKSALSMAVILRGTGMVIHREVLKHVPWCARSITEDAEYGLELIAAGVVPRFLRDVRVQSRFPSRNNELRIQRTRWISGGTRLAIKKGLPLMWRGLVSRRAILVDAGLTTWIVNRPLVIAQLFLTVSLAVVCRIATESAWSKTLWVGSIAVIAGYLAYVFVSIAWLGITWKRIRLLLGMPWSLLRYISVALQALSGIAAPAWDRTPRSAQVQSK